MALKRTTLAHRIRNVGNTQAQAMAGYHPAAPPGTVMTMPLALVQITPAGTVGYQEMTPLITADGAPVPATTPGRWGQLIAAGRP